jgi:hypothetical protein
MSGSSNKDFKIHWINQMIRQVLLFKRILTLRTGSMTTVEYAGEAEVVQSTSQKLMGESRAPAYK